MKNQIKLIEMKWKNVFSYGNKWNQFNFKTGISFISGKNLSNGRRNFTGKSSFLKIIPFALFGKVDGVTKAQIVNWKNKKQSEVMLTFSKNGTEYIIHRGIKPDILSIMKDGKEIPQSSNKKVFQSEFEDTILGIDFDTFMNIVYCDTNNMSSILNASKPVKRDYIEKLFNLYYFSQLKDISNTKKRSIETLITNADNDIKISETIVYGLNDNIKNYSYDILGIDGDKKKVQNKIDIINDRLVHFNLEGKQKELNKLKDKEIESGKDISKFNILVEKIKSKIFYLNKFVMECIDYTENDIIKLETKVSEINNSLHGLVNDTELLNIKIKEYDIDSLEKDNTSEKKMLDSLKEKLQVNKGIMMGIGNTINVKEKELLGKPKEGICPVCMSVVDFSHIEYEYDKILDKLRSEYTELELLNQGSKLEINNWTDLYNQSSNEMDEWHSLKSSMKDYETEELKLRMSLRTQQEKIDSIRKEMEIQKKSARYKKVVLKLKISLKSVLTKSKDIPSFKSEIDELEQKIGNIDEDNKSLSVLDEKLKGLSINRFSIEQYIETDTTKIKAEKLKIKEKDKSLLKYQNMLSYIKEIINLCADDKCKQYAISNFLPFLNEKINYYLNKSGVLFYIKLFGWLDYDIIGPGIKNCSYGNLSGAEKISLDRAVQLASIDVKKQQSSALIDVLILDEVLDSSVDDDGLAEMMDIIKTKQEEDDSKVLIVSHRNELGSLNKMFDHKYCVEMDKYSFMKEI